MLNPAERVAAQIKAAPKRDADLQALAHAIQRNHGWGRRREAEVRRLERGAA
jgi:hypothetical protein